MTLPASGPISLSQVNTELGYSSSATISLETAAVRTLAGIPTGPISLESLYGKSNITWHRPIHYSVGGATGGSVSNPGNAEDGTQSFVNYSTYATISHGTAGTGTESCTFDNFGSGTFSGTLYIGVDLSCSDNTLGATSEAGVDVNGVTKIDVTSNGSGSPVTASYAPYTLAVSGIDLATYSVTAWATGGASGGGSHSNCSVKVYDIVLIS